MREGAVVVKAMSVSDGDKVELSSVAGGASGYNEDDFVFKAPFFKQENHQAQSERRLHLRAFDYWHGLNLGRDFPLFSDLTPEGLSPYKDNALLLVYTEESPVVRFCGSSLQTILGDSVRMGEPFEGAQSSAFAEALVQRFQTREGRTQAAEFEFVEDPIECRGIILPFSAKGDGAQFVMVVVNHRRRSDAAAAVSALAVRAQKCAQLGAEVFHPDRSSRQGLYSALAQTYAFHLDASRDPVAYRKYLRGEGLRQQKRAPFTPALKLTFGKSYDKTRITEYAAALSYAARNEVSPERFVDFLTHVPGGIKGCVQSERVQRRGGTSVKASEENLLQIMRERLACDVSDIQLSEEFGLALVRRTQAGGTEIVAPVKAKRHQVLQAAREILSHEDPS